MSCTSSRDFRKVGMTARSPEVDLQSTCTTVLPYTRKTASVVTITQLSSTCGVHRLRVGLSVRPPLTWQVLLKSVAEELRDNCSLTLFGVLAWSGDADWVGSEFHTSLEHNHTLETLNVDCAFQPVNIDAVAIARGLTINTTLKHLLLRKLQFKEQEIESLAQMLASNATLRTLTLSGNGISSSGAMLLAQVLTKDNTSLTRLDLTFGDLTDVGAGQHAEDQHVIGESGSFSQQYHIQRG